jgi:hypothetical protein
MAHKDEKIGVLYVLHGGMDDLKPQHMWDASVQMFAHDPNHPVYNMVIWNAAYWSMVLQTEFAVKFMRKYEFEYARIGGRDPFHQISERQLAALKAALDQNDLGLSFEIDYACWMAADRIRHYPYPRFIYNGPPEAASRCTYCGEDEPGGPWPDCRPDRYDVDGPAERLLKKGVSRIIMIDTAVGGPRFFKSYDVAQMTSRVLQDWNAAHHTSIPLTWVNDYSRFMQRAYPSAPAGWTPFAGAPETWERISLSGSPNPVAADPELALLHVEGIEAGMNRNVAEAQTGVLIFNHGLFAHERKYFDPKIDDTVVLNKKIKAALLQRHPGIDPGNIIGAYGGVQELNAENGLVERTRNMRGEDIAYSYLYGTDRDLPGGEWGYRYWDGLEYLKNRGVRHIVIGFSQVITDSVLSLVEVYNQIGKEIGVKTWLHCNAGDFARYPNAGHPFADYWGNWVDVARSDGSGHACCLTMGGCADGSAYPPPRQTPLDKKREDMDPSLAFDLSDYGHLGYDPARGAPDPDTPVQDQYAGTWEVYTPPNADKRIGSMLARHVLNAAVNPLVYITNGVTDKIKAGQSITWAAQVVGGTPPFSFAWFLKETAADSWKPAGSSTAAWTWTPGAGEEGTYAIKCTVTDAGGNAGEVVWEDFVVSA